MFRFFLGFMLAVCTVEIFFRITSEDLKVDSFMNSMLNTIWYSKKVSLAMPPFNFLLDKDWDDPTRLDEVYRYSYWPANTDYDAKDFLRKDTLVYKVHINSLGYRGHEVSEKKPKDTFRIAAYGAYATFGEGVNDNETYLSRAEEILNAKLKNKKVEILNGGMESGTFILGLSRLAHEVEKVDADAVLLEYGFIDEYMPPRDFIADGYNTLIGHPEKEPLLGESFVARWTHDLGKIFKYYEAYLYHSYVYTAFRTKILGTGNAEQVGFQNMRTALTDVSKRLSAQGKRVIVFVNPGLAKECESVLSSVAEDSGALFVDGKAAFRKNIPTEQMLDAFDNDQNNFIREIGFERKDVKWHRGVDFKIFAPYYQNMFQLSPIGHQLMGETLADAIEADLKQKKP